MPSRRATAATHLADSGSGPLNQTVLRTTRRPHQYVGEHRVLHTDVTFTANRGTERDAGRGAATGWVSFYDNGYYLGGAQ